jgi:CRP/FNR family cyclic AMP-dependent transcriptional regulator
MASAAVPALNGDPLADHAADDTGSLLAPAPTGSFQRPVRIFEHEPDLLAALSPRASRLAWHLGVADSTILEEGDWSPLDHDELGPGALGLLVLDGMLTRSVGFDHRRTPELIGAGDLLRPWEADPVAGLVSVASEWNVMQRATIALLDEQFAHRMCRVPGLSAALLARALQRVRWFAFHAALAQVRRAEPRLLLLFWHMADRWGRVTTEGIHLPLNLTHGFLASLVCMRRPTVSAALVALARAGEVRRNDDRTWLLTGAPPQLDCIHDARTPRSSR